MELTITYLGAENLTDKLNVISQQHCRELLNAKWYPSGQNKFVVSAPDTVPGISGNIVDQYAKVLKAFGDIMDSLKKTGTQFTCALAVSP